MPANEAWSCLSMLIEPARLRSMSRIDYVFLDDGGVLSDNRLRPPQWEQRIGEFFPPRLGGSAILWAEANRRVLSDLFAWIAEKWARWDDSSGDYVSLIIDDYYNRWLTSMCAAAGIEPPQTDEARVALAREAVAYIMPRVRADYPGTAEAVRRLGRNRVLYTASGTPSWEFGYILGGVGIEGEFRTLYGPDLLNVPKQFPLYYERLFEHSGVDPSASILLDDDAQQLAYARAFGVRTVLVSETAPPEAICQSSRGSPTYLISSTGCDRGRTYDSPPTWRPPRRRQIATLPRYSDYDQIVGVRPNSISRRPRPH